MTFSIVGFDPKEQTWGVAVQSKFLGVGAVVPFAKAGVGAIATQSFANTSYGPNGLALLEQGKSAQEVLELLIKEDPDREMRQVGIIDANGQAATFTGMECYNWAGGTTGEYFAAQGNILVDEQTVQSMKNTFLETEGPLAERLLKALNAGQAAGGDSRGMQSAALLVVKEAGGYGGYNDRFIDLRVDDHPSPIEELIRIYSLQRLYFSSSKPERVAVIEGEVEEKLEKHLTRLGYLTETTELADALRAYLHTENFEMREQETGKIDLDVLDFITNQL
jgi:uncharacterized Ntn-hydrolase superfamily protein